MDEHKRNFISVKMTGNDKKSDQMSGKNSGSKCDINRTGEQRTVTHSNRVSEKTVSNHFGGGMPSTSIPSLYMTPSGPVYLPSPPPPPHMTPHMMPPYNVMIPNTHPDHHVGNSETTVGAEGQSMIINFMCQINQRMTEIQGSVSKLNDIQKDMNQIHIHFNKIQKENYEMRAKI